MIIVMSKIVLGEQWLAPLEPGLATAQPKAFWKAFPGFLRTGQVKKANRTRGNTLSGGLIQQVDLPYKLACRVIESCENDYNARDSDQWANREIPRARKATDEARQEAVEQFKQVRNFHRQARWLTERFPKAKLCDMEGLVKLVDRTEIEANDGSLTLGRYVAVAPEEVDENFDFGEALRDIHEELEDLNAEAAQLAVKIKKNFEELGV